MLRRPFLGMAAGFLLGILAAEYKVPLYLVSAAGFLLFFAAVCYYRHRLFRKAAGTGCLTKSGGVAVFLRVLLFAAAFLCGNCRYLKEQSYWEAFPVDALAERQILLKGQLTGKEIRTYGIIYELSSCMMGQNQDNLVYQIKKANHKYNPGRMKPVPGGKVLVYSDSDAYSIGETLILEGKVELWKMAVNEGNFDERSFYKARKTAFKLKQANVLATDGKRSIWREGLWHLRLKLKQVYVSAMGKETGGILSTMVLGDKELLEQDTKRIYQICGLSHILAVSGLHISIIGMSAHRLFLRYGIGFMRAGFLAGSFICAYGLMTGMGTSVKRAVFMSLLLLLAPAVGRSYDTLNALGAAAVALLFCNPFLLRDAGFHFSFAAVAGVVWVGRGISGELGRKARLLNGIYGGLAVQFATLPVAVWYYYEIPVYAVWINFLLLPFMAPLLSLGVIGGLLGLVSCNMSGGVLFLCRKMLEAGGALLGFCAKLPGAVWITGKPEAFKICLYYTGLWLFTVFMHHRENCRAAEEREQRGTFLPLLAKSLGGLSMLVFLFFPAKGEFELDVLDVGQGDACFVKTEDGHCLFIDGGSSDVKNAGTYRILPFLKSNGVRQIDYWFVSHTDKDHISGLEEILESGYPVCNLVFAKEIAKDEAFLELAGLAEGAGTRLVYVKKGDCLHLGEAEVKVLHPARAENDKNAGSLVIFYEENGFSGIFTGDIGIRQEQELLFAGEPAHADFYKAAHHGSKGSNSSAFLEQLSPAVATVSCGLHNRYGHPGAEAVEHMEEAGSEIFYTMYAGQIKLTRDGERLLVQKYLDPLDVSCFSVLE